MTLTKAQREILIILRDIPNTKIVNPTYRGAYLAKDGERIRAVNSTIFDAIDPYLKLVGGSVPRCFIFDPEAEISDEWPARKRELERQRSEAAKAERQAAAKVEADKAAAWFEATGPYTVDFEGEHFTGSGVIRFNGEFIAKIGTIYSSTRDQTFEAMMKRDENLQHFLNIAEMLRRANREE